MAILRRTFWAALFVFLSVGAGHAAECSVPVGAEAMKQKAIVLVNQQRAAKGLKAVSENPLLESAAQDHACDMAVKGYFSHPGKNRSSPGSRIKATGYSGCLFAENIAHGQRDSGAVMKSWMSSAGHRKNILLRKIDDIGMGVALQDGRLVWVQVLARAC